MASIVNYFSGDKAIQFQTEQIANTLAIGSTWTHLRLGILYQLSSSINATSSLPSPKWAVGLCSGTASLIGSAVGPTHFVGAQCAITTTYQKSTDLVNYPYWWSGGGAGTFQIGTQVGTGSFTSYASTPRGSAIPTTKTGSLANSQYAYPLYIDFIKSATSPTNQLINIRLSNFMPDNGLRPQKSCSIADFYTYLASITCSGSPPTGFDDPIWWNTTAISVPVSESLFGVLDSFCFHWPVNQPMMISEVALYRYV